MTTRSATVSSTPDATIATWLDKFVKLPADVVTFTYAHLLRECVASNDSLPTKGEITRWHAKVPSPIDPGTYLHRLTYFAPFPRDAVLLSIWYLDRVSRSSIPHCPQPSRLLPTLLESTKSTNKSTASRSRARADPSPNEQQPETKSPTRSEESRRQTTTEQPWTRPTAMLNSFTLHRLILSGLLVASKFISDGAVPQPRAAKVGGVSTNELVRLEVEMLAALEWNLDFEMDTMAQVAEIFVRTAATLGQIQLEDTYAVPAVDKVGDTSSDLPAFDDVSRVTSSNQEDSPTTTIRTKSGSEHSTPPQQATPRPIADSFQIPVFASDTDPASSSSSSQQRQQQLSMSDSDASVTSSQNSSAVTSPSLFDEQVANEGGKRLSPPPSPPSSAGYTSDDGGWSFKNEEEGANGQTLVNRASTETVRRMQTLSMT
ncbi:hypothetical protein OIO90_001380 [Microbotryomycetes sp. JL221]|nr:hypothetical protein OIO90_001380 [Microbotryomycetes sp. JL221]